jgi:hypothetical protein
MHHYGKKIKLATQSMGRAYHSIQSSTGTQSLLL